MNGAGRRFGVNRVAWALLASVALLMLLGPSTRPVRAAENSAALVVDYGDGRVLQYCVAFTEDSLTGLELLRRAGLSTNLDQFGGLGAAVCKIGDTGCETPGETCFCKCEGGSCAHWSYFRGDGSGGWRSSNIGASSAVVRDGAVEGWIWTDRGSPAPVSYSAVCSVAAPEPQAPTATAAPPTATPEPPTATTIPPTSTAIPPTITPVPPTNTAVPPTSTRVPATLTAVPQPTSTDAPVEPVNTETASPNAEPEPTSTPSAEPTAPPTDTVIPATSTVTPSATPLLPTATTTSSPTALSTATIRAATATIVPVAALTPTTEPGGRFTTGLQVPGDQQLAQRVGVFGGIIIALLGLMLVARRRMAQLPPTGEDNRKQQPKIVYKSKSGTAGDGDAADRASGDDAT